MPKKKKVEWPYEALRVVQVAKNFGIERIVSDWLSLPHNLEQTAGDWNEIEWLAEYAGEHKIGELLFNYLSNTHNTEQAAKYWKYFRRVVEYAGEYEIAERVFNYLSNPKNAEQAAKNWEGFGWVGKYAGKFGISEIVFNYLSNTHNTEQAAKNWDEFRDVVYYAGEYEIAERVFAYLSVKNNREQAAHDWENFAKRLKNEKFRNVLLHSTYFAGAYAWFEKNGLKLNDEEKQDLGRILENRRRLGKNMKHSAQQVLRYLPPLRKLLDATKNKDSRSFILKHAMFYIAVSYYPPGRFKQFVDSLESSKKRTKEMKSHGINTEVWNNYENNKKLEILGKKAAQITLNETISASAHFQKNLSTDIRKLEAHANKVKGQQWGNLTATIMQARTIQEYAKKQCLPALSENTKKQYLEIIYRYYAEQDNWKDLPEAITQNYKKIEKKTGELLERFGHEQAIIQLETRTWERKLPDDIAISNACGDCTCTSGKYAEAGSNRLADNGYSILKICLLEGKKATHIGNIYCMAYTADGKSCLAMDGIEVAQSFEYGSREVAGTLVDFAKEYAKACGFRTVVINPYPSNSEWIKTYVESKYQNQTIIVNLHKIGGDEHLKEIGLEGAKVLAEGNMEVYRIT